MLLGMTQVSGLYALLQTFYQKLPTSQLKEQSNIQTNTIQTSTRIYRSGDSKKLTLRKCGERNVPDELRSSESLSKDQWVSERALRSHKVFPSLPPWYPGERRYTAPDTTSGTAIGLPIRPGVV